MNIFHIEDHKKLREKEYPPLVEFADAFYWSQNGKPELMEIYLAKVSDVKQSIPKSPLVESK